MQIACRFSPWVAGCIALSLAGCVRPESVARRSPNETEVEQKVLKTQELMSIGEDAHHLYWSWMGGGPPPNPWDNPHASVATWESYVSAQHEMPAWKARSGYLAPDMAEYWEKDHRDYIDFKGKLLDPFSPMGLPFRYFRNDEDGCFMLLASVGPDETADLRTEDVFWSEDGLRLASIDLLYDPTNGIVSRGDIVISNDLRQFYKPLTPYGKELHSSEAVEPRTE